MYAMIDRTNRRTGLLEQLKIAANQRDVPYQSLIKMSPAEKVG